MQSTRPPAVAGMFYPGQADTLSRDVHAMLDAANKVTFAPKALIVPHAGYIYSGPIAASAYAALSSIADRIRRVVLLGPTHRVFLDGLALPGADAFSTPLGDVPLDTETMQRLTRLPQISISPAAHAQEHSLEVQVPFLQAVLHDFKLLPLAVGRATAAQVAEVLETVWGGEDPLIVISSDLSHYLPYDTAKRIDTATTQSILDMQEGVTHDHACGATPINGLLHAAQRHHLTPHLLDLRNSGDTAGSKEGVVGYAAFAFEDRELHS